MTQIDYDYFTGRAIYATAKTAAKFEALRNRAKLAAGNPDKARAVILAVLKLDK